MQEPPRPSFYSTICAAASAACFGLGLFGFGVVFGSLGVLLAVVGLALPSPAAYSRVLALIALLANGWLFLWSMNYILR